MPLLARMRTRCARFLLAGVPLVSPLAASAQDEPSAELGKRIFIAEAQPPCGLCHALADAGTTGEIGPSLDELKPTEERVRAAVRDGVGVMPAYETLSEEEIAAVARYVATAVGQAE
jgi:mono/diheme cytochrome c family protein